jgi:hypothetical protein
MAHHAISSTPTDTDSVEGWVRRAATLTIVPAHGWPEDEVAAATALAGELSAIAASLLARGLVTPDGCAPGCATCAATGGCTVVRDLAGDLPRGTSAPAADLADYRRALASTAAAVSTCRRTFHVAGRCLFGADDLCGRVLAAAHHLR